MLEDVKNVEQSVTFYNVTGYIEKENRIYFAPLNKQLVANAQAGTTKPLCQWYKDYFDSVVGILSSRYQNVSISRWSPSDRTLSVQGTIDLFRKSGVSSDSKAFNYMIVKRIVTGVTSQDASINYTYYMGYFITDVQQSGTNTVRLTLDIDNFTNAFYLMNTKQYSDSELLNLDIFNSTLVNCNVERQHYNRVKLVDGEVKIDNNEIFLNPLESYDYKYQKKVSKSPILVNGVTEQVLVFKEQTFTDSNNHYSEFVSGREYIIKALTPVAPVDPTNCEITFSYNPNNNGEDYVTLVQYDKEDNEEVAVFGMYVTKIAISRGSNAVTVTYYDPFGVPHTTMTELVNPNSTRYYWTLKFGRTIKPTYTLTTGASDSVARNVFNEMNTYRYFETTEPKYNFSKEDLEMLENSTSASWGAFPNSLKSKLIMSSLHYVSIKAKESITCGYGIANQDDNEIEGGFKPNKLKALSTENTKDALFNYIIPIIIPNKYTEKFMSILKDSVAKLLIRSYYLIAGSGTGGQQLVYGDYHEFSNELPLYNPNFTTHATYDYTGVTERFVDICGLLGSADWSDYILSASIIKDYNMADIEITQYYPYPVIKFKCNILGLEKYGYRNTKIETRVINKRFLKLYTLPKGLWLQIVPQERKSIVTVDSEGEPLSSLDTQGLLTVSQSGDILQTAEVSVSAEEVLLTNQVNESPLSNVGGFIFLTSGYEPKDIDLELEETDKYLNLTEEYYDPILENNPYTFYSVSYSSGLEVPFNKQKYYNSLVGDTYHIKCRFIYSNNDAQKLGLITYYSIDSNEFPYYNDSLIVTISSQLPMACDTYAQYYYQNLAQMKNQYAVNNFQRGTDLAQTFFNTAPASVGSAFAGKGTKGGYAELIKQASGMIDMGIDWSQSANVMGMNFRAQLAGAGAKPDIIKQAGSDIMFDLCTSEMGLYLNYYRIDDFSYNSIAKGLERYGYLVNRYDTLHVADRVGWNYVKLISADFNHYGVHLNLTTEQESDIMDIFKEGVTLLHSPEYLYNQSLHNHETLIDIDD